ncbi:MAG: hypothetical protein O3A19_13205 [Planctomycetota bacterium]|nr:hypothetical protein [Planctomycetota bacterium]
MRNRIRGFDQTQLPGLGKTSPPTSATRGLLFAVETVQSDPVAVGSFGTSAGGTSGIGGPSIGGLVATTGGVDAGGFGLPPPPSPQPPMTRRAPSAEIIGIIGIIEIIEIIEIIGIIEIICLLKADIRRTFV